MFSPNRFMYVNNTPRKVTALLSLMILVSGLAILTLFQQTMKEPTNSNVKADFRTSPLIVDHNSVALFDQIPQYYLDRAADMNMMFSNRSVGMNMSEGLNCLEWPNNTSYHPITNRYTPNHCRVWDHLDDRYDVNPSEVNWNVPGGLSRANWKYGIFAGTWDAMLSNFITALESGSISLSDGNYSAPVYTTYRFADLDVFSFQFSYLNIDGGSIANQPGGFVANNPGPRNDIYDLDNTINQLYPDKTFLYMTTSLARGLGSPEGTLVNERIRQFVSTNNKVLLDVADIESHDPSGQPCFDNRDGVEYCRSTTVCENFPDDGADYPAICQHYTSEHLGGHLGSPSAGKIRITKAFWVLMAQLAGWNPNLTVTPTPYPSYPPFPTPTSVLPSIGPSPTVIQPTATPTRTPTPTRIPTPAPTSPISGLSMHVSDLDGFAGNLTRSGYWQAQVRVYVHDANHLPVVNAIPQARINGGSTLVSCFVPTNNSGFCNLYSPMQLAGVNTVNFQITNLTKDGYSYNAATNHDVDGGSDGTSISVTR